ncbi:beta-propeller domain-containing protein [Plantactinospora sp. S1510]|uniref:Beta-propeller domain-containing protein n=1 Tax=Plantactinospora alkalitolerans TaxID=2789879 RepID=A0ABS0GPJ7_9ACTN|nr:beta-propeller domain-containing protein [Plantactinospora alkalitolerans]MBF9128122.1 beta-propeller domain-containing protein [Plantactinospora alkalitolerans]
MRRVRGTRAATVGTALFASLTLLSGTLLAGCTADPEPTPPPADPGVPASGFRLVAFDSCTDALAQLKSAAKAYVGPYGFASGGWGRGGPAFTGRDAGGPQRAGVAEDSAGAQDTAAGPAYSGTNTHEAGVDEPDLVKTDGRRIVTVSRGTLRVVDPASRRLTGSLKLDSGPDGSWFDTNLLLHGDRALVLVRGQSMAVPEGIRRGGDDMPPIDKNVITGARLILVDLAGPPKILGEYRFDGDLVDARQVGATARVVVRSAPRLEFPLNKSEGPVNEKKNLATNRKIVDEAGIDAWLPRYQTVTADGRTSTGRVGCDRVSRPAVYSGTSLISILSFDLGTASLGDGDPVTVAADGDTVYSNGSRLYIASDLRWRVMPSLIQNKTAVPEAKDEQTEIYQFDTSGPGHPRYVTAATVPGFLINQYALSEWDGHLRVATTSGRIWDENSKSSSSVYVLRADGRTLTETGRVTGLGKGERIYSVRFAEGTGYVVTFRQTDPLYTVDLRDPRSPRVTGELKINGYSAYLHPVGAGRLIGIGQEADSRGRVQGTQVSLFDVSDLDRPTRIAQHHVRYGHSEAEFDPHAFLYWPATNSLVVPLSAYGRTTTDASATGGALVLRVTDGGFTEAGRVDHAEVKPTSTGLDGTIRRSLMIDGVLWTVSDGAVKATDLATLSTLGVIRT